jgi:ferredoxin-type protein NapH
MSAIDRTVRQRIRKSILLISFILFPITLYYLSPVLIVMSAAEEKINASFIVFFCLFISSLFFGRFWCGWLCPAGAMLELATPFNNGPIHSKKLGWVKWGIWVPWMFLIIFLFIQSGGIQQIDPLFRFESGITFLQPYWYFIYFIVIGVFLLLSIFLGKRAGCHSICWMAPFMILGRWIRNKIGWLSLQLEPETIKCTSCKTCTSNCPMSLKVDQMVKAGNMENAECILCASCADGCSQSAIKLVFNKNSQQN